MLIIVRTSLNRNIMLDEQEHIDEEFVNRAFRPLKLLNKNKHGLENLSVFQFHYRNYNIALKIILCHFKIKKTTFVFEIISGSVFHFFNFFFSSIIGFFSEFVFHMQSFFTHKYTFEYRCLLIHHRKSLFKETF